jgi:hypothetical protein
MENQDIFRLESGLAGAEARIFELEREVRTLLNFFAGKTPTNISVPSGVPGLNYTYDVMAMQLGAVPDDTAGSFICSYSNSDGTIEVGPGSYQYPIGTNVDVETTDAAAGKYVYAELKQNEDGGLAEFTIRITSDTKDAIVMSGDNTFVEFSNCLLAEVVGSGDTAELIQRRVGNLSLIYRIINGSFCLWPETTGGASLPDA